MKRSIFKPLLAFLVVVTVTLLLSEGVIRAWFSLVPPLNHNLTPQHVAHLHMFEPGDSNVFYRVKPDYEQTLARYEFKTRIRTNNVGFREDRDYRGEPVDISFVGDSFTFGWGVEAGERYSDRVAESFPGLNVLSYSYPNGNSPVNYLSYLQHNPHLLPEVLVLGLFAFNDLAGDMADSEVTYDDQNRLVVKSKSMEVNPAGSIVAQGKQDPGFPSLGWWSRNTAIGRLVTVIGSYFKTGGNRPPKTDKVRGIDKGVFDDTAREALGYVVEIDRLARAGGSTLVVFYIPFPSIVTETPVCLYTEEICREQRAGNALGDALAAWAGDNDIHFIDPVDHFRAEISAGRELYYPFDAHWTPAGHSAAGELIAEFLRSNDLVPPGR